MQIQVEGNIVDLQSNNIYKGQLTVEDGKIVQIVSLGNEDNALPYIMPGFIDSHVHIESSMLVPAEFGRLAVVHGTVGSISDPHEIANVCGIEGVHYMIENSKTVPFKATFGAPSCVPATTFETAGDEINCDGVESLLQMNEIKYLSEMMNFPGALVPSIFQRIKGQVISLWDRDKGTGHWYCSHLRPPTSFSTTCSPVITKNTYSQKSPRRGFRYRLRTE